MKVSKLFNVHYGTNLELNSLEKIDDGINFVSRTSMNNGVSGIVRPIPNIKPLETGLITVAAGGSPMSSFVQPQPFYSGRDVFYLKAKKKMSLQKKLFYCMCLRANKYRYSYGRQANRTLRDLELPDKIPEWINKIPIDKPFTKDAFHKKIVNLHDRKWKYFIITDLFHVTGTKTTPKKLLVRSSIEKNHSYPYITTSATSNGVYGFFKIWTEYGQVLTVDSAVRGTCFYQHDKFSASDHVEKLVPKFDINVYVALFLSTIINKEQYRYSYGRKSSQTRIKNTYIKLPCQNNEPDWPFMEDYIKSLPYSTHLKPILQ